MKVNNFKKSQARIILFVILVGFFISILEAYHLLDPAKNWVQQITVPLQISLFQAKRGTEDALSAVTQIGSLRDENSKLIEENAFLSAENERLRLLEEENKALRDQLGVKVASAQDFIVAKIIGESPVITKKLILIDKGETSGIKKGMMVVVRDIIIGEIYNVSPRTSSVQLISDPDTKIPAITNQKVEGLIVGQFGAEIQLQNVVQGKELNEGDLVLTSGEGGYPGGLVIGKIKQVNKIEKELFQKAQIDSLIDPRNFQIVFVINE